MILNPELPLAAGGLAIRREFPNLSPPCPINNVPRANSAGT
jgi:hypothetical protein